MTKSRGDTFGGNRRHGITRVAHVALQLDTGGLERLLVEFARHADRSRYDLRFISLTTRGRMAEQIEACGWPVTALELRPGVRPAMLFRLAREFRGRREHIVHTHNTKPLLYAGPAARLAGVPGLIHTRHGQRWGATARHDAMFRLASACADRVVCVSGDSAGRTLHEGVSPRRVRTISNGIDLNTFERASPRGSGPVVFVGRLSREKNIALLLRAMAIVVQKRGGTRLHIAGDGPCRVELERLAADLGLDHCVTFLGEVAGASAALSGASLFVLPSLSEGMPVTVLEAMACGLPVVATNVGGVAEAVIDGQTGFLVRSGKEQELAAAMLRLLGDPGLARVMGEAGRRRVESDFDIRTMVAQYESLYRDVLGTTLEAAA